MKYLKPKIQKESNTYVHMNIPRGVKKKIFVGNQALGNMHCSIRFCPACKV